MRVGSLGVSRTTAVFALTNVHMRASTHTTLAGLTQTPTHEEVGPGHITISTPNPGGIGTS